METYSFLRELADSWVLLLMTAFIIGVILWAFRPGSRAIHEETANIPFRNDDISGACEKNCPDCKCRTLIDFEKEAAS